MIIRARIFFVVVAALAACSINASAYPMFLEAYKSDKFTNPKNKDVVCNFCHMSPSGGDERNPFGQEFEKGGEVFTPMLRAQYPDRFTYPMLKADDNLTVHFSDPESKIVIIETGGKRYAVDAGKQTIDGRAATPSAGIAAVATPSAPNGSATASAALPAAAANLTAPPPAIAPTDPFAREGAFFGQNVVNLPNGKPQRKGEWDFWIGHRFAEAIFQSNTTPDLWGFDNNAIIGFGVRVGVTDRVSVSVSRSNFFRTLELSSSYQISRQGGKTPLTLQARASVEGRNNFIRDTDNPLVPWVGYAPSLQLAAVRTFADRISIEAVPTFAFNTRNPNSRALQFGASHDNTIALGLGGGVRLLKTVSAVGEVTPRWGFRGEGTDRPEIAFGIEKATFRHAFSLIFSDTRSMTVNRYAQGTGGSPVGQSFFGIGFNIFRRIR